MIIDYNFFGLEQGCVWDTPVCTDLLDELQMNEGVYDEAFIELDTSIEPHTNKPTKWTLTTIMDAKFTSDLDAGSISAEGFDITKLMLYRSVYGTGDWDAIGEFKYDEEFNLYDFVDRYVQNGSTYQYAIVPVANEVIGDKLISDSIDVSYEGIFLTDKKENKRLEYDISLGEISYNTSSNTSQPLNSPYPIVTFGNSNYRSSSLTVLPLSKETVSLSGSSIDKLAEQINRQDWMEFLNNSRAKVLRMDSGVLMLVVTKNARVTHKEGETLRDLASISFDYVEIGKINYDMLIKNDLISRAFLTHMTYDDEGDIISVDN
ncbi:hypothetical protein RVS70_05715 [Virgibacillus sp. M23]|uniref:hypothetical protein n=1 Tax=Virgibacillus sp. M23 TaxID=3079030 RepID=UPI002A90937E|nr:hypothetical protein [Virgibacillus sp. M23]MDY7043698.1 hypothetical protein [Virgibacillus sp. M23]